MKRLFLVFLTIVLIRSLTAMEKEEDKSPPVRLDISYASAIPLVQNDLRNVRSKADSEKEALFKKMPTDFPLEPAVEQINKADLPQVILWFSNYFGSVSQKTVEWYQENVFRKMPKATFWLTDLKSWRFLSVDAEQLKKNYASLIEIIKRRELTAEECPLIDKRSDVLDEDVGAIGAYKLLSSQSFFKWLLNVKDMAILPDDVANKLCRDIRRSDSMPYSLSAMGYKPALLNRCLDRYKASATSNMLEVDFSLVYPVLQYLEGVYYAAEIIKSQTQLSRPTVVFLLPNKEFAYYLVPEEASCFKNFKESVERVLMQEGKRCPRSAAVQFMPFAYGEDFYDAPYKLGGKRLAKKVLLEKLGEKL